MTDHTFSPRQTITGLLCQMHASGFNPADLQRTQQVYRVTCLMFSGRVRKTERVFICHAVGAASAMVEFGGDLAQVLGAMLHAAYDSGQFPDGRIGGDRASHRRWLASQAGADVEEITFRYARFPFHAGDPERLLEQGFSVEDSDLLFIALAHELDDMMDLGLRFAAKYGKDLEQRLNACEKLANQLGQPELAKALRSGLESYADADWTDPLASETLHGYVIVPGFIGYLRQRYYHWRGRHTRVQ